jgi:hypothetical protein
MCSLKSSNLSDITQNSTTNLFFQTVNPTTFCSLVFCLFFFIHFSRADKTAEIINARKKISNERKDSASIIQKTYRGYNARNGRNSVLLMKLTERKMVRKKKQREIDRHIQIKNHQTAIDNENERR